MRWTQTLIPTQKETPADAVIVSHQLMIRAGLIRQLTAGAYDFLPLGFRALRKASQIVREEMDRIGCAEVFLPALQPVELWQKSGRDVAYGDNLMKFKDRHGRVQVLGPTHEEVITEMVAAYVSSYKQLPLSLYQIQTKFRDEFRPRFGLLRVREFLMKDAYSFHADLESLNRVYDDFYRAYEKIFTRCGIPYVVVEAESGPIGGSASHEFMAACAAGEDTIVRSDKDNYAANVEKAEIGDRSSTFGGDATGALEKVHTPNLPGIEDVGKFMKVKPKNMLKSMVCVLTKTTDDPDPTKAKQPWYLLAIVRGDHDVNEPKLAKAAARFVGEPVRIAMAPEVLARKDGFAIGFVGPHAILGRNDSFMLVDPDAAQGGFWASGANELDHHVKHFNWAREVGEILADPAKVAVADIRNAMAGDPSPKNDGGKLVASKGIEIGHVFKLGTKYSDALGANYLDDKGGQNPLIMGCYGIGVGRILIAAVESLHDEKGIIWPAAIAPFSVVITPIKYEGEVKTAADKFYDELNAAGIDALLDDRLDARPGVKFADADLIGIPVRITIGDRGLKEGKLELKRRSAAEPVMVPADNVISAIRDALKQIEDSFDAAKRGSLAMSSAGDSLILTINGGSSSIKFALFDCGNPPRRQLAGQIEPVGSSNATLTIKPIDGQQPEKHPADARDQRSAIDSLLHWLDDQVGTNALASIGHRIVHGGPDYAQPERVSVQLLTALRGLSSIDPAHLPGEIELIEACGRRFQHLPQIACFDTAFHHDLPPVARRLPIPRRYDAAGLRRYGFHGLSYEYLIGELARIDNGSAARGRIILAHLGNGASLAAVRDGKPIDTSMSFTPTAGLVMGSRSGDLDPGVLIHLMRSEHLSVQQIDDLVNRQSGMRGISETTSDMRDLLALRVSGDVRAADAVASFCYAARKYIGAFTAALGGLDTLVFSGGIGEHLPPVRREICQDLGFLGVELDADANTANNAIISAAKAAVTVRVIPTDEEAVIAAAVCKLIRA